MARVERTPSEIAERVQRRRNRVLWVTTLMFGVWQFAFYRGVMDEEGPMRLVNQVKLAGLVVWAVALTLILATGGGFGRGRAVRDLLQDEATQAHRRSAYMAGYWAMMIVLIGVYIFAQFQPVGLGEAVHAVLTVGVVVPAVRFVFLERRSERS